VAHAVVLALTHEALKSVEFRILQVKFSSGVTLRELRSIASVLCQMAGIKPPSREENRHFPDLIKWFRQSWPVIAPWLPLISLRDERNRVVDGRRELFEKSAHYL
jgi:hypothetical protein